jgi:Mitochondrial carrier protein
LHCEKSSKFQFSPLAFALHFVHTTTATLHPIDTAKTLRQANPQLFTSTTQALSHLLQTHGPAALYAGVGAAVLGAMPSSALYFGAYESMKLRLAVIASDRWGVQDSSGSGKRVLPPPIRAAVHVLAAASGNAASSLVFVPKEFIKQRLALSISCRHYPPCVT